MKQQQQVDMAREVVITLFEEGTNQPAVEVALDILEERIRDQERAVVSSGHEGNYAAHPR